MDSCEEDNSVAIKIDLEKQFNLTDDDQIDFIDRYRGQTHDEFLDRLEVYFCFPEIYLSTLFNDTDGALKEIFMFQDALVDGINQIIDPAKLKLETVGDLMDRSKFNKAAVMNALDDAKVTAVKEEIGLELLKKCISELRLSKTFNIKGSNAIALDHSAGGLRLFSSNKLDNNSLRDLINDCIDALDNHISRFRAGLDATSSSGLR